jgi:hypothetical protein
MANLTSYPGEALSQLAPRKMSIKILFRRILRNKVCSPEKCEGGLRRWQVYSDVITKADHLVGRIPACTEFCTGGDFTGHESRSHPL